MSLAQPISAPAGRSFDRPAVVAAASQLVVAPTAPTVSRAPGRHREPGSTPWRTALRELAVLVTFGYWVPWRPAWWRARLSA